MKLDLLKAEHSTPIILEMFGGGFWIFKLAIVLLMGFLVIRWFMSCKK